MLPMQRARLRAAFGLCAGASRTLPGDCFRTRPILRRSIRGARDDGGPGRASPAARVGRHSRFVASVRRWPSRAAARWQCSGESRGRAFLAGVRYEVARGVPSLSLRQESTLPLVEVQGERAMWAVRVPERVPDGASDEDFAERDLSDRCYGSLAAISHERNQEQQSDAGQPQNAGFGDLGNTQLSWLLRARAVGERSEE